MKNNKGKDLKSNKSKKVYIKKIFLRSVEKCRVGGITMYPPLGFAEANTPCGA